MSKPSRENTLQKMKGAGDGIRNHTRSSERVPFPSSRKFTATSATKNTEKVQNDLKRMIDEMEGNKKLKKSLTMAEITPTRSARKKTKRHVGGTPTVLHATPRPPVYDAKTSPSGRVDDQRRRRQALWAYRRWLLFVWRRNKMRAVTLSESKRRHQEQVASLEHQVNCLRTLNSSELVRRTESIRACQKMETLLQAVNTENENLNNDRRVLQGEVKNLETRLEKLQIENENMKNETNTKNIQLQELLENEIKHKNLVIQNKENEKTELVDQVKALEVSLKIQEEHIESLKETLKISENRLKQREDCENLLLKQMNDQLESKKKNCTCLENKLAEMCRKNDELRKKIVRLEERLCETNIKYTEILKENECLKGKIDRKLWWKNTKNFLQVSWVVIKNAAYIMLPAL